MGKITGFIEYEREVPQYETVESRIKNYQEFELPFPEEKTTEQAARCMDCGVPFCHSGCPLGNKIPDFNHAVYNGDWAKAWELLKSTNNFPEFTGRICPAPCEGSCVLGINQPAVSIEHIEKSIAEKAFELGLEKPRKPKAQSGNKVAVIGSGPAGLAAADQLNQSGHQVTVFERDASIGGLLRYGIPDFKLSKTIVQRRVDLLEKEGITFKTNTEVGIDISHTEMESSFDAIVLCLGSTIPRDLDIPGRDLQGIHFAMDFLKQQNQVVAGEPSAMEIISAEGKDVVVIGGGDTGSDCIGTSNRQEAESITQIEIMDKPPMTRSSANPWPEWPMTLRTSSSHQEGCDRKWAIMTRSFIGDKGHVTGLRVVDVDFKDGKMLEKPETERTIPAQLVLIAAGFVHPQKEGLLEQLDLKLDGRGNVATEKFKTSTDKYFAAGDMRKGQSLVVWAISEGRKVAAEVNSYLGTAT